MIQTKKNRGKSCNFDGQKIIEFSFRLFGLKQILLVADFQDAVTFGESMEEDIEMFLFAITIHKEIRYL